MVAMAHAWNRKERRHRLNDNVHRCDGDLLRAIRHPQRCATIRALRAPAARDAALLRVKGGARADDRQSGDGDSCDGAARGEQLCNDRWPRNSHGRPRKVENEEHAQDVDERGDQEDLAHDALPVLEAHGHSGRVLGDTGGE